MSGSGHNHSFNTIVHNNKMLLNRRNIFRKDSSFLSSRKAYLKASKGFVDVRKASKQELLEIRKKVIKERRRSALKTWIFALIFSVPVILLGINVSSYFMDRAVQQETESINQELIQQQTQKGQEILEMEKKFKYLVADGDNWLNKGNVQNAIHQYESAVSLFPNKFEASLKLTKAYFKQCEIDNTDECVKGREFIKKMKKQFPNHEILIETN